MCLRVARAESFIDPSDRLVEILVHRRRHPAPLVCELVRYSRGRCRPRRYRGGGSGRCVRSKQSDIALEPPSRSFKAGKLKIFWQKRTRLTCEFSWCEMWPAFAKGLNTRQGTREPLRNGSPLNSGCASAGRCAWALFHLSTTGGSTWSNQPPQSSQVMKIAVLSQSPPLTIAFTCSTVQRMPSVTFCSGCSLRSGRPSPYTQETAGSRPEDASCMKRSRV